MNKKWFTIFGIGLIFGAMIIAGLLLLNSAKHETPPTEKDVRNISIGIRNISQSKDSTGLSIITYSLITSPFQYDDLILVKINVKNEENNELYHSFSEKEIGDHILLANDKDETEISLSFSLEKPFPKTGFIHQLSFISNGRAILPFTIEGGEISTENLT